MVKPTLHVMSNYRLYMYIFLMYLSTSSDPSLKLTQHI